MEKKKFDLMSLALLLLFSACESKAIAGELPNSSVCEILLGICPLWEQAQPPCTTRLTGENMLRVFLPKKISGNDQDCEIMIDQSHTIDNWRIHQELGRLPTLFMSEVKEKVRLLGDL